MKVIIEVNDNNNSLKKINQFKLYDLGQVSTTIDDLIFDKIIQIDETILPVLRITDINDVPRFYLINNLNKYNFKLDFLAEVNEEDLIEITSSSGGSSNLTLAQVLTEGNDAEGQEIILSNIAGDIQKIEASSGDIIISSDAYKVQITANGGLKVDNGIETKALRIVNATDDSKYVIIENPDVDGPYIQQTQSKNGIFAYTDDLDLVVQEYPWKLPAKVNITTNITMIGLIPQEAIGTTHQGITINVDDRVVLSNQTNPIYNGIYRMNIAGGFQRYYRTYDANTTEKLNNALISITSGTSANKVFRQTTASPIIGTNNIVFSEFGSVSIATNLISGILKLYSSTGIATDGTMTQASITVL